MQISYSVELLITDTFRTTQSKGQHEEYRVRGSGYLNDNSRMVNKDLGGSMRMRQYLFSPWCSVFSQSGSVLQILLNSDFTIIPQPQYSHLYIGTIKLIYVNLQQIVWHSGLPSSMILKLF